MRAKHQVQDSTTLSDSTGRLTVTNCLETGAYQSQRPLVVNVLKDNVCRLSTFLFLGARNF